jgi:NAD(P)-dependent dehydrogenase (short-subunit alcohol dehydrogenase family)
VTGTSRHGEHEGHLVALVTGSTGSLGEATARTFAEQGAKVVVTGRKTGRGKEVAESICRDGGDAHFVAADLSQESEVEALISATVDRYESLTTVVNNAAPTEHILSLDK